MSEKKISPKAPEKAPTSSAKTAAARVSTKKLHKKTVAQEDDAQVAGLGTRLFQRAFRNDDEPGVRPRAHSRVTAGPCTLAACRRGMARGTRSPS